MKKIVCDMCGEETRLESPNITAEVPAKTVLVIVEFTDRREGQCGASVDLCQGCRTYILRVLAAAELNFTEFAMQVKDLLVKRQPEAAADAGHLCEALREAFTAQPERLKKQ